MIAALRQNALPIAMILVCAAALYLVYRDMKKIDARLNRLDAAVVVLAEEQHAGGTCAVHDEDAFDDYEAALMAEDDLDVEVLDPETEPVAEAEPEPEAEPEAEPEPEAEAEPVAEAQA